MMMGGSGGVVRQARCHDASTLQHLTMQERRESLGPDIREAEDIPQDAVTASLDGVMVAGQRGRPFRGLLARGGLWHGLLPRR